MEVFMEIDRNIEDRFWKKVNKKGPMDCWEWIGAIDEDGYGRIRVSGSINRQIGAHRLSYAISHKDFDEKLMVCHHCDNRKCVNPNHLFLGSAIDNYKDMVNKNRRMTGNKLSTIIKVVNKSDSIVNKQECVRDKVMEYRMNKLSNIFKSVKKLP
jgi:hypothetical protein